MKIHTSLIFAIMGLLLCSCKPGMPVEEKLQQVLDKGIAKYDIHGVSAAVVFPDGEIWHGVSGVSHGRVPIEPDMLFATGSVTKNFVATLTLALAEDGALSLEDPVSKWLPSYPHVDGDITIRQLLNHTSGLYMFWDNQEIWDDLKADRTRFFTPEEVLGYIKEPEFDPGNGWRYSNTNYLLLAMIIQEATGSDLSTELKSRFFQPLGMADIYLSQEESLPENLAHVYGDNFNPGEAIRDITFEPRTSHESITYGSSGIFTTAENLARWSQALFGGDILGEQSLNEMLNFVKIRPVSNMRAYGLGVLEFRRLITSGQRAIGHSGGNIGTTTFMVYLPEHQVSIAVMINAYPNDGAEAITKGLIQVVLKDLNAFGVYELMAATLPYSITAVLWIVFLIGLTVRILRKKRNAGADLKTNP